MDSKYKKALGITGCVIGFIALVTAFLSPQIAEAIDPPSKPLEESVADFAVKLKDATVAKMKGEEYQSEPVEKKPSEFLITGVIAIGMLGSAFGLGSLFRGEKKEISIAAILIGIAAAIVQWSIIFAAALIFILLIAVVLNALGLDFPSF